MASENIREIVLDMLLSIEREEEYSHRLVGEVLTKYSYLTAQERAFLKRLFEGTLERRIEMDYRLNDISNVPTGKMKPLIRNLLRMSAYQLLYMDSVPDAAAVNEAVRLAGKRGFSNLKGFVNGVLRKLSADKAGAKLPSEQKDPERFLSVTYSMPEWMVAHFLDNYSYEETKDLLEGLLHIRPVMIRFFSGLSEEERTDCIRDMERMGVKVSRHTWVKEAWYLHNCENIALLPGFEQGFFTVQDASSMLAVAAAGIRRGDKVLDICAAPGGKSLLAAEYAGPEGRVEARDNSPRRMERMEENLSRMGLSNVSLKLWNAVMRDETAAESADVVLADVPCSGLGVMGRKRDIKYRQTQEGLDSLVLLQRDILRQAVDYVKPGGTLLYSTCTINPKENEEQVDWLCKEFGFVRESMTSFLPADLPHADTAKEGFLQLLPNLHDTDGFFFSRLKKPILP
ncbi:MAG: 16S rRNA (cytosine(967)-C(5))-methyltransferase RsmB [Lachnospiraceae bacterium]|nr:16S rRNA (cytosine(967)-C(5))-methyltransferase RsmB [Lachnospiraceae bacterium]